ncbi:MAG: TlyA family RNA methyltransferase [Pseudomonadota bacterium]
MSERSRADRILVERGFFDSRAAARAAIEAGGVSADGVLVVKPSQLIDVAARIEATPAHPYVSRGGLKLSHALNAFGVDPADRTCLDIGASTGGFSDAMLRRGAARIYAVDVGHGQLHQSIASDPRMVSLEGTDARRLDRGAVANPPSLVVCDVSFIGLEKLLARPLSLSTAEAELIALFKPQFQVGRAFVGKGGVVTDEAAADRSAAALSEWLQAAGWPVIGWEPSPITGADGNKERLLYARRG